MSKNYFFDLDGTLYLFDHGKFIDSSLQRAIKGNVISFLGKMGESHCIEKYGELEKKYGEDFSIAFEEVYKISKEEYFTYVWNLEPKDHVHCVENISSIFQFLKHQGYNIFIASDAPIIWINRVIQFLGVNSYITKIYSGQGNERKSNGELYRKIQEEIQGENTMIGDQEQSDIVQSKEKGFRTIYVSYIGKISGYADKNISSMKELMQ